MAPPEWYPSPPTQVIEPPRRGIAPTGAHARVPKEAAGVYSARSVTRTAAVQTASSGIVARRHACAPPLRALHYPLMTARY